MGLYRKLDPFVGQIHHILLGECTQSTVRMHSQLRNKLRKSNFQVIENIRNWPMLIFQQEWALANFFHGSPANAREWEQITQKLEQIIYRMWIPKNPWSPKYPTKFMESCGRKKIAMGSPKCDYKKRTHTYTPTKIWADRRHSHANGFSREMTSNKVRAR